ncbi:MAG: hypothetical protein ACK56F_18760, partial [bacterium]
ARMSATVKSDLSGSATSMWMDPYPFALSLKSGTTTSRRNASSSGASCPSRIFSYSTGLWMSLNFGCDECIAYRMRRHWL